MRTDLKIQLDMYLSNLLILLSIYNLYLANYATGFKLPFLIYAAFLPTLYVNFYPKASIMEGIIEVK